MGLPPAKSIRCLILALAFAIFPRPVFGENVLRLSLPPHSFPPAREAALWSRIAIPVGQLERRLFGDLRLSQPERNFVAAINALQALLFFSEDRFLVALNPYADSPRLYLVDDGNSQVTVGRFLVGANPRSLTPQIAGLESRRAWQIALEQIYRSSPENSEWELAQMWRFAMGELAKPPFVESRNEAIAAALNAWHQTHDPLARVIPIAALEDYLGVRSQSSLSEKIRELNPRLLTGQTRGLGVVELRKFFEYTGALELALRRLENSGAAANVLDLRNNPGSTIEEARNVLNLFLDDLGGGSVLFYTTDSRSNQVTQEYRATRAAVSTKPLVVLVDASTKSVAELVAGVLQHHRRAWIVGDISFGKGTFLEASQIPSTQALLYESKKVLHYVNGGSPQEVGVIPDFRVMPQIQNPRLIDLYLNTLPFESPHFIQTRSGDIQKINECIRCLERHAQALVRDVTTFSRDDQTLQKGLLVAECQLRLASNARSCP